MGSDPKRIKQPGVRAHKVRGAPENSLGSDPRGLTPISFYPDLLLRANLGEILVVVVAIQTGVIPFRWVKPAVELAARTRVPRIRHHTVIDSGNQIIEVVIASGIRGREFAELVSLKHIHVTQDFDLRTLVGGAVLPPNMSVDIKTVTAVDRVIIPTDIFQTIVPSD